MCKQWGKRGKELEALGRFELPTCGLGNRRSIHLSYRAWNACLYRTRFVQLMRLVPGKLVNVRCNRRHDNLVMVAIRSDNGNQICAGGRPPTDGVLWPPQPITSRRMEGINIRQGQSRARRLDRLLLLVPVIRISPKTPGRPMTGTDCRRGDGTTGVGAKGD